MLLYLCQRGQQQHLQWWTMSGVIWVLIPSCTNSKSNLPAGNPSSYAIPFGCASLLIKLAEVGVCGLQGRADAGS